MEFHLLGPISSADTTCSRLTAAARTIRVDNRMPGCHGASHMNASRDRTDMTSIIHLQGEACVPDVGLSVAGIFFRRDLSEALTALPAACSRILGILERRICEVDAVSTLKRSVLVVSAQPLSGHYRGLLSADDAQTITFPDSNGSELVSKRPRIVGD